MRNRTTAVICITNAQSYDRGRAIAHWLCKSHLNGMCRGPAISIMRWADVPVCEKSKALAERRANMWIVPFHVVIKLL
jgi:hypothetical protein